MLLGLLLTLTSLFGGSYLVSRTVRLDNWIVFPLLVIIIILAIAGFVGGFALMFGSCAPSGSVV